MITRPICPTRRFSYDDINAALNNITCTILHTKHLLRFAFSTHIGNLVCNNPSVTKRGGYMQGENYAFLLFCAFLLAMSYPLAACTKLISLTTRAKLISLATHAKLISLATHAKLISLITRAKVNLTYYSHKVNLTYYSHRVNLTYCSCKVNLPIDYRATTTCHNLPQLTTTCCGEMWWVVVSCGKPTTTYHKNGT